MMLRTGLMAVLLIVVGSTLAIAGHTDLTPTASTLLTDTEDGDVALVRFDLGALAEGGRITRAVLRYDADTDEGRLQAVLIHRAPSSWTAAGTGWWDTAREAMDLRDVASFDTDERGTCTVTVDITRWVRAWRSGSLDNDGLVFWMPAGEDGLLPGLSGRGLPTLRVIQRPRNE